MKPFLTFFFLLTVLLVGVAHAEDVKVGIAGPMSGGLAAFGEQIKHGAELAADDINQHGGLLGQKFTLVKEDDACDPKQAHSIAQKMVGLKVDAVFGHWCAAASMAASTVYGEEGLMQLEVGTLLVKLTHQNFPFVFRLSTTSKGDAQTITQYVVRHNPKANVAIITDTPAVTMELTQYLEDFLKPTDNKIVAIEQITGGNKDFSSTLDRIRTLKPDVIICSCYTLEAGLIARQMHEKNMDVYFYGWDTFNSPDFLNIVGEGNTSKIISIDYERPKLEDSKSYGAFVSALNKKKWPVETTTIITYAAMQVYADAVRAANSLEPAKVAEVLHKKNFDTIIGPVSFDAYGDRKNPRYSIYQWVGHDLKVVGSASD